jgi:hypothetical protein
MKRAGGTEPKRDASALIFVPCAMLSQHRLDTAVADLELLSQYSGACTRPIVRNELANIIVRQAVPHAPNPRDLASNGCARWRFMILLFAQPVERLCELFLQVSAVRVAPHKLHPR